MCWLISRDTATGGYTITDSDGKQRAEAPDGGQGAQMHACALQRIEELAAEVIAVGVQLDDARAELVLKLDAAQREIEAAQTERQTAQRELDDTLGELELAEKQVAELLVTVGPKA